MCFAGIEEEIRRLPAGKPPKTVPETDEPPTVRVPNPHDPDFPTIPAPSVRHPKAA